MVGCRGARLGGRRCVIDWRVCPLLVGRALPGTVICPGSRAGSVARSVSVAFMGLAVDGFAAVAVGRLLDLARAVASRRGGAIRRGVRLRGGPGVGGIALGESDTRHHCERGSAHQRRERKRALEWRGQRNRAGERRHGNLSFRDVGGNAR
jgi:hypothetical protein